MAVVAAPPRALADMKGDVDASTLVWFEQYANDLPSDLAVKCRRLGSYFLEAHGKRTLGTLFKLNAEQALKGLKACDLEDGWLETLEDEAGFSFKDQKVPDSAALVASACSNATATGPIHHKVKAERKRPPTISEELQEAGTLEDERLPAVDHLVDTVNPESIALQKSEVTAIVREIRRGYLRRYGKSNLGMPLCRVLGKQLEKKFPRLPSHGKTAGHERRWWAILGYAAENGIYVSAIRFEP